MEGVTQEQFDEIGRTVEQLRKAVEAKHIDKESVERMNAFLDTAEEKNQKLVALENAQKQHEADMAEYKEALEKAGATEAEAKSRMDQLESELARAQAAQERDPEGYKQTEEYKALEAWCVQGDAMEREQKQLLRTDSATDGGVLTTTEMDSQITKKIVEIDGVRAVSRVRSISAKSMEIAIRNTIPTATYEGETEQGADSTSTYESETVTPYRQTFTVPITQDMLQDAAFDMESEITGDSAEAFAFGEGNGFILGTGFKQPSGIFVDSRLVAAARDTLTTAVLAADDIILITGDLKVGYNPSYILNRRTLAHIRTLKSTTGQFLWQPGLNGPVANTLNGFTYVLANSVPDIATGALVLAFGDFRRGYTITDRTGMSVIRDQFTLKKKAIVEFTMNRWNTGQVTLPEAIKLLRIKT